MSSISYPNPVEVLLLYFGDATAVVGDCIMQKLCCLGTQRIFSYTINDTNVHKHIIVRSYDSCS